MKFSTRLIVLISCTLAVLVPTQLTSAQPTTITMPKMVPAAAIPEFFPSVTLHQGDNSLEVAALQKALTQSGWPTWVDGDYGPHTYKTVMMYQKANGLVVDGIAGPQTLGSLGLVLNSSAGTPTQPTRVDPNPVGNGSDVARQALVAAGASSWEADFGVNICYRESRCTLSAVNWNPNTHDNSWGPFQINYYGSLYSSRAALLGEPSTNTSSWLRAAQNFLKLGRTAGWCHWMSPNYCS